MRRAEGVAVLLLLCLFGQAVWHARTASITFDEGPHLTAGYAYLRTGDLRLQPVHIHPPLANILAAAPLLFQTDLPDPRSVDGWEIASLSALTDALVWRYSNPGRLALAGRVPIVLMTLLLGAVVFRWGAGLFGRWGGVMALGLCAFDPNIIAHGSLVTTDMAVTLWGTVALFLTWRSIQRSPAISRGPVGNSPVWHARDLPLRGAGVSLGLALASKASGLSLVPVLFLLWLLGPERTLRLRLVNATINLAVGVLVLWAIYGFELRPTAGIPWPVPAATHLEIYRSLQEHYRLGHPAFLLGRNSDHGWWYYFPVAFLLKTPPPTLLLAGASVLAALWRRHLPRESCLIRWGSFLLFPAWYLVLTPFSSVNIGYRHLLPVLPFLILGSSLIGRYVTHNTQHAMRIPQCVFRVPLYALLLWLILGTVGVAPHYLAFFNELAGGPDQGYRYLVDSNLDWGQSLWELRDWMRASGVNRVFYAHFSPARPQVYGVEADFLPPDPRAVPFAPFEPEPGVYVVGATVLQGVYAPDVNTYAWFRTRDPLTRLGYALYVYRVEPRPAPAWAAVCAHPVPVLAPGAVRAGFSQPGLRVVLLDCQQGWVWPAGGRPGRYVLTPEADPPPGATLDIEARHPDGRSYFRVFRVEQTPAPQETAPDAAFGGPLAFLGYRVSQATVGPGQTLELQTFWEVLARPDRPLSLMGHLVGPDGTPIAVSDGTPVSVEQWQTGDIIVQRHRFLVPEETAPGRYQLQTGAYWLDTLERWEVYLPDGTGSDWLPIAAVEVLE